MAGSQNNGPITAGRINLEEGSWAPGEEFKGGPPGIPGSPRLTVPNDFPELELNVEPAAAAGTAVVTGLIMVNPPALGGRGGSAAGGFCGSWNCGG